MASSSLFVRSLSGSLTLSNSATLVKSYEEISEKNFILDSTRNLNPLTFFKSIEIVYGLRNFVGNANKFANENIFIKIESNKNLTNVIIEDDGAGFPKDILNKIGEPYLKSFASKNKSKKGLGLGIFIGKTLLEKNKAKITFKNSKNVSGAEISITWKNSDLLNL